MNKIKLFLADELRTLKKDVSKIEYLLWWLVRFAMAYAFIRMFITDRQNTNVLLLGLNIIASFTVPLMRLILIPKKLFKKLSFRCQTWLTILIFLGSFLGQGMLFNHRVPSWDKFLHFVAGIFVLFIGNEVIEMFMRKDDRVSPLFRTFSATGFSYIAIVVWEIFEFFVDYYWPGSTNQAYNMSINADSLFVKIFGLGAQNENQAAVFDTNVDMLYAVIGSVLAAVVLYIYLSKKEKKSTEIAGKESVTAYNDN